MKKEPRANEAFNFVLAHTAICRMTANDTHAQIHDRFAFVAVRDTLIRLNIDLPKASSMAGEVGGTARQRFSRLKPELKSMGFYNAGN